MRLVDDDGELAIFMFLSNLGDYVRELFYCGYNDAFAILYSLAQISGMLCPDDRVLDLHELFNRISDLLIQNTTVSDYQNGVDHRMTVFFKTDQLMRKPCDRIGLTATCAVLDQVPLADTILLHVCQQLLHAVQLMITRPDLFNGLFLGILVHLFNDLRVVFNNAGQFSLGEDVLPEIVRHEAVRIRRISCSVVIALVER